MTDTKVIEKTVEAAEAVNEMNLISEIDLKSVGIFAGGAATALVVEHVVIPTTKKAILKIKTRFGKKKVVVVTAEEVVDIEE